MKNSVNYKDGTLAWQFVEYPNIQEPSGVLGVIEYGKEIDFTIKRIFFLRDIDSNASRGFHAHDELKQFLFCAKGSLVIELDNGEKKHSYTLTQDSPGLLLDGKVWREMHSFSNDALMMVLCDREYQFDTVVRDYDVFKKNLERN